MTEYLYNNIKNASTDYRSFKSNCGYYPRVFYKEDINPTFILKLAKELSAKLRDLIIVYWKKLHYSLKLQKQAYDKTVKLKSDAVDNTV